MFVAVPTATALVLTGIALGAYEAATFKRTIDERLTAAADIVGRSSAAAIEANDREAVGDLLRALQAEPAINAAAVFSSTGDPVASYVAAGASGEQIATPRALGARFHGFDREVVVSVTENGAQVGTVVVRAGIAALIQRISMFAAAALLIILACGGVALALAVGLQRRLSRPILELAETARRVTADRNFSLRAPEGGHDEVGRLVGDFNQMLTEIERQNVQLHRQQEQLTEEVAARTAALQAANTQLQHSVERSEHYATQITQLTTLGQLLQSCLTSDEIYGVVPHAMHRLFPEGSGALSLIDPAGNTIETTALWGPNPPNHTVFEPAECWAFRRGRPHLVTDLDSPIRCAHLTRSDGPVSFCIPMTAQGDTVGILQFSFAPGTEPDEVDDNGSPRSTRARLVVALAEQIALALANLRLREALHSQSVVDALTGLFNRRYLESTLDRECRRALRAARPLAVLMVDVDHFKTVNDTWGHEAGDVVLRELSGLLRAHFRGDDIACRFGGEEFVVVLPEATLDVACERAEQFRLAVHRLTAQHRQRAVGPITVSIGVAGLPLCGHTPEVLLEAADRALYRAKTEGRDRLYRADPATADAPHAA